MKEDSKNTQRVEHTEVEYTEEMRNVTKGKRMSVAKPLSVAGAGIAAGVGIGYGTMHVLRDDENDNNPDDMAAAYGSTADVDEQIHSEDLPELEPLAHVEETIAQTMTPHHPTASYHPAATHHPSSPASSTPATGEVMTEPEPEPDPQELQPWEENPDLVQIFIPGEDNPMDYVDAQHEYFGQELIAEQDEIIIQDSDPNIDIM